MILWRIVLRSQKTILRILGEFYVNTVGTIQVNRLENLDYRGTVYIFIGPWKRPHHPKSAI